MQLLINQYGLHGAPTEVLLNHNGEQLAFNIALFDKMSFSGGFDIFAEINSFWARMPAAEQDKVFDIYKQIKDTFDSVWDTNDLTRRLYVLIQHLYDFHDLSEIRHWADFHSNLILPEGLKESFKESHETPGTRERTYLKEDYKWLVALSIALRVMIPIWGEFIARTRKEAGTTFKEYYAFQLLSHSNIFKSEPMERLRVYVEHSLPQDKSKSAAVFGGLSSEDFPSWMLSLVVVRRLSIGDVRGTDPMSSLVTFIYKYIGQKAKGYDNNFIGIVKEKIVEGQGQEGETNLSKLEGYKIKQENPAGDIAIIEHYLENPVETALKICSDIDPGLVEVFVSALHSRNVQQIWKPQTTLTQWVLASVIPPKGLLHVSKPLSLNAMGAAQALLWHKGHYELAALVSATEQINQNELLLGGIESQARIQKEQLEQLDRLYPYSRKPVGKQKVVKRINPAAEAIDSIAAAFGNHDWWLTIPAVYVERVTGNPNKLRYAKPYDIKVKLARLAIELANRTF